MSMTHPPGWYRDPSYPLAERWWDGTAWTDHRRQSGTVPVPLTPPGPAGPGPGRARAVALVTAGAVLVTAIVTGVLFLGRDDDGSGAAAARATPAATSSAPPGADSPTAAPTTAPRPGRPSVVVDELNGITLPLPKGWTQPGDFAEDDLVMTTPGTYDCPGDPGLCRRGRVSSRTVTANAERSPRTLAERDVDDAARAAYDRDVLGGRPYRGITSHRVVKAAPIAVAGRAGYLVRWRVATGVGPGGYVESLAFASSVGSEAPVIVRFAFDAGADGPPLADMDRIAEGIRPTDDADTSGGVGSSIGPSR